MDKADNTKTEKISTKFPEHSNETLNYKNACQRETWFCCFKYETDSIAFFLFFEFRKKGMPQEK